MSSCLARFRAAQPVRPRAARVLAALSAPGLALASSNWPSAGQAGTTDATCAGRGRFNSHAAGLASGTIPGLPGPGPLRLLRCQ